MTSDTDRLAEIRARAEDYGTALTEAMNDIPWLLDELARVTSDLESRRQVVAMSDRARLRTIESLLDALGITDDHTEADVERILDGCDCNAEGGTDHLVWHLAQKLARVTSERDGARAAIERVRKVCAEPDDTQWWPVQPYMDPPNDDEVVETRVLNVDRVLAALDADPTEGSGS